MFFSQWVWMKWVFEMPNNMVHYSIMELTVLLCIQIKLGFSSATLVSRNIFNIELDISFSTEESSNPNLMRRLKKTHNQAWKCLSQAAQIMAACHMILHSRIDIIA